MSQSCTQTRSEINRKNQKLRDLIDLKEKKLLNELELIADKERRQLTADIKEGEMTIYLLHQQLELIDRAVKSDSEMDIFEIYLLCESRMIESEDGDHTDLIGRSADKMRLKKNTDHLIKVLYGDCESKVMNACGLNLNATPVLRNTIDVSDGYPHGACPVDVTVLDVNGIETVVVTDYNRTNSVKSLYTKDDELCLSKLTLDNRPWSLTNLTYNQVAVTVRWIRQIVTVVVNPDLTLKSTLTTKKQYRGITALTPSTLAVGSRDPPSVDILDMTGTIIRSLTPSAKGKDLLRYPNYLSTTNNGNILVSDNGTKSVLCLTPQGDVVFNYSPNNYTEMTFPHSITVTNTGDILVADSFLDSVLHITESGQFVRNVLTAQDGIIQPYGLCIDRHGCLYVSLCSPDNDRILVFSFGKSNC